jgi:DMSO reductase anchor subunit
MELQWPLIIFTTFVAWSAGVFGTQSILALRGEGEKSQMPCWITAAILLVIGGIAVFFHLEHWERIFNGFGHLTSGITQELIAIVVLAIIAVIYLVYLRKDATKIPSWVAICAIVVSAVLVAVMAHSYMMAARPAWNNILWIFYVLGNACVLGPATVAFIQGLKGESVKLAAFTTLVGSAINAITTVVYAVAMQMSSSAYTVVGYYSNPTVPTENLTDISSLMNVFTGDFAPIMWIGVILVGAALPLVSAFLLHRDVAAGADEAALANKAKMWMAIAVVAAIIGAICMRVVFYEIGISVFMYY